VQNSLWTNYNIAIASSASKRKNKRTIVAVFSALKNRGKKKAVAKKSSAKKKPVKKAPAKKVVAKKAPAKKAPAKKVVPKKIELKKDLNAKDVQAIVDAKTIATRQKEILAELESRGVTSINRIPKKTDKDLVDEARALAVTVPLATEKLRKAGLGSPFRMLKKVELELIAPPAPKVVAPKIDAKTGKPVVVKIDGQDVELEEVELEDVESLIAEAVEIIDSEAEDKGNQPRVVDLKAEDATGNEENAFTLKASEEDDAPAQTVMTAGATADPVKDYLKQIGRVALLNAELEVELATRVEAGLFAEYKLFTEKKMESAQRITC